MLDGRSDGLNLSINLIMVNFSSQQEDSEEMKKSIKDWDQPEHFPDPDVKKPDDWDEEMDGEWEPLMISNLDYK
ncbi:unnamed protein product [Caretta caretta]